MGKNNNRKSSYKNKITFLNTSNTLIFLDWDDTLFPTTWSLNQIEMSSKDLKKFDHELSKFLNMLRRYGKIVIVTNGSTEWFKSTISYLKITKKINIKVISASELYGKYSNNPTKRKMRVFHEILDRSKFINIISIGDSYEERNALLSLRNTKKYRTFKSIKFIGKPRLSTMINQICALGDIFDRFYESKKNLNIKFNVERNKFYYM